MEKDLHFLIHNMMTIFIHLLKHSGGQSCVVKSKKKKKLQSLYPGSGKCYILLGWCFITTKNTRYNKLFEIIYTLNKVF